MVEQNKLQIHIPNQTNDWEHDMSEQAKYCGVIIRTVGFGNRFHYVCELFDGEPFVMNGIADVAGWVEFHGEGKTIEEAFRNAQHNVSIGLDYAKQINNWLKSHSIDKTKLPKLSKHNKEKFDKSRVKHHD